LNVAAGAVGADDVFHALAGFFNIFVLF